MSSPARTRREEIANGLTHAVGLALSVAGLAVLVVVASLRGSVWHVVGCAIYGATLVVLFNFSMLYHLIEHPRAKHVFRILDHSSIFLLIAGTYTPFMLDLRGGWGWSLFGVVWGLALAGIACESVAARRFRVVAVPIYLLMGWLVVLGIRPTVAHLAVGGLLWLLAGGLLYSGGVVFYVRKRQRYAHTIWHLFVLGGSLCHWISVMWYVVPGPVR